MLQVCLVIHVYGDGIKKRTIQKPSLPPADSPLKLLETQEDQLHRYCTNNLSRTGLKFAVLYSPPPALPHTQTQVWAAENMAAES